MDASQAAIVFAAALVTALATGLGALPLEVPRLRTGRVLGIANAVAGGVMLGASLSLVLEGVDRGSGRTAAGVIAGAAVVWLTRRLLGHQTEPHLGALRGADARKGLLIVAVMTVHSVAEGAGIGSSFGGGAELGLVITFAIAVHNIPEGLAISLVLVPRGTSVRAAAGWSIFSSLPQPLLAVPAFLFVEAFESALPIGLGFAAGAMAWMVATELLPDAVNRMRISSVAASAGLAFALMFTLQTALLRI